MRRSRRKGHQRRTDSLRVRLTSTIWIASSCPSSQSNSPLRASDEATTPETDTLGLTRWVFFVAHTVHRDHGEAIGYRVTALDELPGIALTTLLFHNVATFVADSRGVDEHLGSCECHEAGCFGIPLVPADEYAERPDRGLDGLEAQIPG